MKSLLKSTHNTRDLGGYPCSDGTVTKEMVLLRSDAPKQMPQDDMHFLLAHGIRTVIDLRTTKKDSYRAMLEANGFDYRPCRISAGSSIPNSAEEVPVSYLAIAESPGMADALRCIAEAGSGALFHCSAGKDRTGVLSAILLLHAGVAEDPVIRDYALTKDYAIEILQAVFHMFPDADRNVVTPHPEHMAKFLKLFSAKYHDTTHYMQEIGLSERQIDSIRTKLKGF